MRELSVGDGFEGPGRYPFLSLLILLVLILLILILLVLILLLLIHFFILSLIFPPLIVLLPILSLLIPFSKSLCSFCSVLPIVPVALFSTSSRSSYKQQLTRANNHRRRPPQHSASSVDICFSLSLADVLINVRVRDGGVANRAVYSHCKGRVRLRARNRGCGL